MSKQDKVKFTNSKKLPKIPASIVEGTEWTRFCPQTDGRTDRRTDRQTGDVKPVYSPFNFVEAAGIKTTYNLKEELIIGDVGLL